MTPDPRGSPSDEEYIKHLEFFNEQRQRRIEELMRERHKPPGHVLVRKIVGLCLYAYLWIPLRIAEWSGRDEPQDR